MNNFIEQNNNILKIENDIISSIKDDKNYEILKLKNNLEIILIEDKNLKQSSALMNVDVGSVFNYENKPFSARLWQMWYNFFAYHIVKK